jgi:hypothetical protein
MNLRRVLIAAILCFPVVCAAQEQIVIPLKAEPHHHLILHNDFVNVYAVELQICYAEKVVNRAGLEPATRC